MAARRAITFSHTANVPRVAACTVLSASPLSYPSRPRRPPTTTLRLLLIHTLGQPLSLHPLPPLATHPDLPPTPPPR